MKLLRLCFSFENHRLKKTLLLVRVRQLWHNFEMHKYIFLILSAALFSTHAMAKSECDLFITKPLSAAELDEHQRHIAEIWMDSLGANFVSGNKKWSFENILSAWNSWIKTSPLQREQALALELLKISDRSALAQPVISLKAKEQLKALSAENSTRMLKQLAAAFPASNDAAKNIELSKIANRLSSKVSFSYGRPVNSMQFTESPDGYDAPIASPRELGALELSSIDGFYSRMIGTSPSAEFITLGVRNRRGEKPQVGTILRRETILLKNKFALENGFALPRFTSVDEILDFFEFWDPAAAEELFRANWNLLPASIKTYQDFRIHLNHHPDEVFSPEKAFTQLAPLRTRLSQYMMTTEDSEEFLRLAFRQYIMSLGAEDMEAVERLKNEMSRSSSAMNLFKNKIFPFLHIPAGMSLRIPVAVSADNYTLSRVEDRPSAFARPSTDFHSGPFGGGIEPTTNRTIEKP